MKRFEKLQQLSLKALTSLNPSLYFAPSDRRVSKLTRNCIFFYAIILIVLSTCYERETVISKKCKIPKEYKI